MSRQGSMAESSETLSKAWRNTDSVAAGTSQGKAESVSVAETVMEPCRPGWPFWSLEFTDEGIKWGLGSLVATPS